MRGRVYVLDAGDFASLERSQGRLLTLTLSLAELDSKAEDTGIFAFTISFGTSVSSKHCKLLMSFKRCKGTNHCPIDDAIGSSIHRQVSRIVKTILATSSPRPVKPQLHQSETQLFYQHHNGARPHCSRYSFCSHDSPKSHGILHGPSVKTSSECYSHVTRFSRSNYLPALPQLDV
jgi:hypothetical protein